MTLLPAKKISQQPQAKCDRGAADLQGSLRAVADASWSRHEKRDARCRGARDPMRFSCVDSLTGKVYKCVYV